MTSVTVSVDQLVEWGLVGYVFLHVMFGLVTHSHSVAQVRKWNKKIELRQTSNSRVSNFSMCVLFLGRMSIGLPWFVISRLVAPVGNKWHWTPGQIAG